MAAPGTSDYGQTGDGSPELVSDKGLTGYVDSSGAATSDAGQVATGGSGSTSVSPTAGVADASVAAYNPTPGVAAVLSTANLSTAGVAPTPKIGAALSAADVATAALVPGSAVIFTVSTTNAAVAAYNATGSSSSDVNATAGVGNVSLAAFGPATGIVAAAPVANVAVTGHGAARLTTGSAGVASATATAYGPKTTVAPTTRVANLAAGAPNPIPDITGVGKPIFGANREMFSTLESVIGPLHATKIFNGPSVGVPTSFTGSGGTVPAGVTMPIVCIKPAFNSTAPFLSSTTKTQLAAWYRTFPTSGTPVAVIWQEGERPQAGMPGGVSAACVRGVQYEAYQVFLANAPGNALFAQCFTNYSTTSRGSSFHNYVCCAANGNADLPLYGIDWYPNPSASDGAVASITPMVTALRSIISSPEIGAFECNYSSSLSNIYTGTQDVWWDDAWGYAVGQAFKCLLIYYYDGNSVFWSSGHPNSPTPAGIAELQEIDADSLTGGGGGGGGGGGSVASFTSPNSTTFTVGIAGTFSVTTTGGSPLPALTKSGTLPSGVTFLDNGNATGTLSGTPAIGTHGTYPLTFSATNSAGTATQGFTLTVSSPPPVGAPTITSANSHNFTLGQAGTFTVTATGSPTPSLSESGSLPTGLTFTDNGDGTATITGTPSAAGTFPLTITATNSGGTDTQSFTLFVAIGPTPGGGGGPGTGGVGGQGPIYGPRLLPNLPIRELLQFHSYDLVTGRYVTTLPWNVTSFGRGFNSNNGSISASLLASDPGVQRLNPWDATTPSKRIIVAELNGNVAGCYYILPRSRRKTAHTIAVNSAPELWSYMGKRVQAADYSIPPASSLDHRGMHFWREKVFDPTLIATQIIKDAITTYKFGQGKLQNATAILGGIDVLINGAVPDPHRPIVPELYWSAPTYPYSSPQSLDSILQGFSQQGWLDGFDYALDVEFSDGPRSPLVGTVNLDYPRRGSGGGKSLLINADNARDYSCDEDGTTQGNVVYETGVAGLTAVAENIAPLLQGWPVLEYMGSHSQITGVNLTKILAAIAAGDLYLQAFPPTTFTVTMPLLGPDPVLGDFDVGDDVRLFLSPDELFPDGIDETWRIISWNVNLGTEGDPTMDLVLNIPPATAASAPAVP